MSKIGETNSCTLIEQKRMQWAKEKEEMANLCTPWGKRPIERYNLRPSVSSDCTYYHRNSLPPLTKPPTRLSETFGADLGGETSGYASDCAQEGWQRRRSSGISGWSRGASGKVRAESPDSISTSGERPRWGDRGVGVGHLWEPNEVDQRPSLLPGDGSPPGWLQRGLKSNAEITIVSHGSEKESSEDTESSSGTRTYLRGQNIPLDASILAERERKRQRAIEHQQAIREQLEERERKRREERERQEIEDQREEIRIQKEREKERERILYEEKMNQERIERERKREEAMRRAIENAERAAKLDKQKLKQSKTSKIFLQNDKNINLQSEIETDDQNFNNSNEVDQNEKINYQTVDSNVGTSDHHSTSDIIPKYGNTSPKPVNNGIQPAVPLPNFHTLNGLPYPSYYQPFPQPEVQHPYLPHTTDGLALVLQTSPYPSLDANNLQFALLMAPQRNEITSATVPIPVAIPLSARNSVATNTFNVTENRILTPTKYRQKPNSRDMSTQTEDFQIEIRQKECKYGSLDRQTQRNNYRERRLHSEERISVVERPKWGVNRPPKQYLTQSEKDPLYQRRKLRQKLRELKISDEKYSSDDSRSPSPPYQQTHRSVIKRNEKLYLRNVNVYQTEIMPIEADAKGRLYVGQKNVSSRRQSISEKFLVAKQKRDREKITTELEQTIETRKMQLNKQNENLRQLEEDKRNGSECWDDGEVLNQLSNLKNGLAVKQKQWNVKTSPRNSPPDVDFDVM